MESIVSELMSLGLSIGVAIAIFVLLRSIMLWYWKIPQIVKNQEAQIRLLKKLVGEKDTVNPKTKDLIEKLGK